MSITIAIASDQDALVVSGEISETLTITRLECVDGDCAQ